VGVRILQGSGDVSGLEPGEAGERPQCVDTRHFRVAALRDDAEMRDRRPVAPLDEQPLRGFPPPRIRVLERARQFRGAHAAQVDRPAIGFPAGREDPIDPAAFLARLEVEQRARGRELGYLLDTAACMLQAGLARTESRGAHSRPDDFPTRDDENFLKHTLVRWADGGPELDWKPVTITKWQPAERSY